MRMNRRQFTASLGVAALPFPAFSTVAACAPAVPASTYAWAQLIVRAQSKVDPAMLARMLRLSPDVATELFSSLVRNGVLRAPCAAGIAQAVRPIQATGRSAAPSNALRRTLANTWEHIAQDAKPLVNDIDPALGCRETTQEETPHAGTSEPLQESPQSG